MAETLLANQVTSPKLAPWWELQTPTEGQLIHPQDRHKLLPTTIVVVGVLLVLYKLILTHS